MVGGSQRKRNGGRRGAWRAAVAFLGCMAVLSPLCGDVIISEVMYHDDDPMYQLEFVELRNTSPIPADMSGWSLQGGVRFTFSEGFVIPGGGHAVIARKAADVAAYYGVAVAGEYAGRLDNAGDAFDLKDAAGALVDRCEYSDRWPWPVIADGGSPSLERVDDRPAAPGDPAAWLPSRNAGEWRLIERVGHATSTSYRLWMDAAGECLIDDVELTPVDNPSMPLVANGTFDTGVTGWAGSGSHGSPRWEADDGYRAPGCLRIVAGGPGSESVAVRFQMTSNPTPWGLYRLRFRVKHVSGSRRLEGQFVGGGTPCTVRLWGFGTPGRINSVRSDVRPPVVLETQTEPEAPVAGQDTTVHLRIASEAPPTAVQMFYRVHFAAEVALPMTQTGDGVWSAVVPAAAAETVVRHRVEVETPEGVFRFPPPEDPTPTFAFFVAGAPPDTPLPCAYLFVAPADLARLNANVHANDYVPAMLVIDGEAYGHVRVRYRGHSVRGHPKKFYKLRFNRGRRWNGQQTINLNSEYPDYSRIRSHIAHTFFQEADTLASATEFFRLHLNRIPQGVYLYIEDPEEAYLRRQGRSTSGNLYKCYTTDQIKNTVAEYYRRDVYRKATNQEEDRDDLITFITSMNSLGGAQLQAFMAEHVHVERMLRYIAMNAVFGNSDWGHKNHYLFHDRTTGLWEFASWDLDLSMGKTWNPSCTGVGGAPCGGVFCHQGFFDQSIEGAGAYNLIAQRVMSVPAHRARYDTILAEFAGALFTPERLTPWIEDLYAYLEKDTVEEVRNFARYWCQMTEAEYYGQRTALRLWVPNRRAFILARVTMPLADVALETGDDNTVTVTWTPAPGHVRVRVLVNGRQVGMPVADDRRFVTAPLARGTHEICVIAQNSAGRASEPVCGTVTFVRPAPPGSVAAALAIVDGGPGVRVTWKNGDAYNGVRVHLDRGDGFQLAAEAAPDALEAVCAVEGLAQIAELRIGVEGIAAGAASVMSVGALVPAVPPVHVLFCQADSGGREVSIFYQGGEVPGGQYHEIEVLADGAAVARFDPAGQPAVFVLGPDHGLAGTVRFTLRGRWFTLWSEAGDGAAGCEITFPGGAVFVRGDANGDGTVNVSDAITILGYLFSGRSVPCVSALDTNDDGAVNMADAVSLLMYLFAGGPQPPPPYPHPGTDPTPDSLDCG